MIAQTSSRSVFLKDTVMNVFFPTQTNKINKIKPKKNAQHTQFTTKTNVEKVNQNKCTAFVTMR